MEKAYTPEMFASKVGEQLFTSDWLTIDQDRIDQFAQVTEDEQFIHVDPEKAKSTPFDGTIAHGFLTLSLLTMLTKSAPKLDGAVMGLNYGFDKIRFLTPVKTGSRIRCFGVLVNCIEKAPGQFLVSYDITIEIEGGEKPALVARWITLLMHGV